MSVNSYWFNKANLFTLLFEFNNLDEHTIYLDKLEQELVDLENKMEIYYNGNEDEIKLLTSDETKYFEFSRQGSHELAAREHRGKTIRQLISKSLKEISIIKVLEDNNSKNKILIKSNNIDHSILIPTTTGLTKNIMDATSNVREFLKANNIHNYENQLYGPNHKVKINGNFVKINNEIINTEISLYRSNGRGDYRIWFSGLGEFAHANDELALINKNGIINIYNITKYNYLSF